MHKIGFSCQSISLVRKYKYYIYSTGCGCSASDENVVDDDKQRGNANDVLSKSPERIKDNKNIENNAKKSSISIGWKKRKLAYEVGMAPKACVDQGCRKLFRARGAVCYKKGTSGIILSSLDLLTLFGVVKIFLELEIKITGLGNSNFI